MGDISSASRPATLRFGLPCDLKKVREASEAVHAFLAEQGCGDEMLSACDLAFVEACNNAIQYAPEAARAQPVGVEIACSAEQLELRVSDHTRGFHWPERVELPPPESESGRGLFLIQSLMDSSQYLRGKNENVLVLRKAVAPNPSKNGKIPESERMITGLLEELSSCYESLSAILRYSAEQQNRTKDLKTFAHRLLSDLSAVVGAEWFVFRVAANQSRMDVLTASESALDAGPIIFRGENCDAGFLESQAAISRKPVWLNENHRLEATDPLRLKPRSRGLVYPVFVGEEFVGSLAIGKGGNGVASKQKLAAEAPAIPATVFTVTHVKLINTFAQYLAIQIVNGRLQEEMAANRLIARELEIAGSIQRSLMLKELPQLPGFEIAAFCRSAEQVGGDFYDVLKLTETTALLVIADVMGKGVLAAMFAAILRAVLRATPELNRQPAALLARVNQLLFDELSGVDMFITAQLVFVDTAARKLVAGSAGHCPLLIADGSGRKVLSPEGMPLGILQDAIFASETVDLAPDARVLMYTDGLTEAADASGERFGQERLMEWFKDTRPRTASELQTELANIMAQFQAKTSLNDDQTFLIIAG